MDDEPLAQPSGQPDAPASPGAGANAFESLNPWNFVEHARHRLTSEIGIDNVLATELLLSINRASTVITYDLEATCQRPHGRSWASFRVLYALWIIGPSQSYELAAASGMSRAAVSNLTGPLERSGMIERRVNESDRRSVVLRLSELGNREVEQAYRVQHQREVSWAAALSVDEQQQLVQLLAKLMAAPNVDDVRKRP